MKFTPNIRLFGDSKIYLRGFDKKGKNPKSVKLEFYANQI